MQAAMVAARWQARNGNPSGSVMFSRTYRHLPTWRANPRPASGAPGQRALPCPMYALRMPPIAKQPRLACGAHRSLATRLAAAAVLFVLVACKEKPRPQRPTPTVAIDTVRKGPLPYVVTANGEVEANRTVAVQSQVSGMLTRVAFAEEIGRAHV